MNEENRPDQIDWQHFAGIFLLSLATLLLELSLTRVLSVALWYHFGFLVISTALLGFGASGVVLAIWKHLREKVSLEKALAILALLFGVSTVMCFWVMQRIPFDPFSLFSDWRQMLFMPVYYVLISTPFFFSGLALALLFTRSGKRVNSLYAFDLFGAGLGCVALAVVMPAFGGSGSVVAAAALGCLAAVIFGLNQTKKLKLAAAAGAVAFIALAFFAESLLPISITPNKSRPPQPPLYTEWNTFSKIDLYESPPRMETDGRAGRVFLFDGGTAATGLGDMRPDAREVIAKTADTANSISNIAYLGMQRPKILIIGSGAGAQVADALRYGAGEITAVEVNPIINRVMTESDFKDFWGGMYDLPEVRLVTDEGRSFVRRSDEQYDAIISVHTISNAAVASGALSLAENYVLTREAFNDYLDRLTQDGILFLTRPESQMPRLFATGREALAARGISDFTSYFYAYRQPPSERERQGGRDKSFSSGFLMKKSPFSPAEIQAINDHLRIGQTPKSGTGEPLETLYSPVEPKADSLYYQLLTALDLPTAYAAQAAQIEPTTDDRPFFNQNTRWSSIGLGTFRDLFTQNRMARLAIEDRPVAEVTLITLLIQSVIIAAVLILLPLLGFSREGLRVPQAGRFLIYFAGLGLGFIMIEIALLQRFTLFLGQPVYTFAVVLAALLIFTGAGAFATEKFGIGGRSGLRLIIPLIMIVLALTAFLTPPVFTAALGWPLFWRIALSILMIAPLGLLLGMPFPLGVRIAGVESAQLVPWAWGVNGFFTVIGTVLALIFGMTYGFKIVLMIGALCYLVSLAAMTFRAKPASAVNETLLAL